MQYLTRFPANKPKYLLLLDVPTAEAVAYKDILQGGEMYILKKSLEDAGIPLEDCLIHSYLPRVKGKGDWPTYFKTGSGLKPEFADAPGKVSAIINTHHPSIVVPLGAFPLYEFSGSTKIREARGYLGYSNTHKIHYLPSYSPYTINKEYSLRAFLIQDLMKAKKYVEEGLPPGRKFPNRTIYVCENLDDVKLAFSRLSREKQVAIDIETHMDIQQISTISFAYSPTEAYVLPLLVKTSNREFWTPENELLVWGELFDFMTNRNVIKIFHNGPFDMTHLFNAGVPTLGQVDDTMYLSHSIQPEIPKSLAILGSVLCDVPMWKSMRVRTKDDEKVED